jgi:hypothetical protein
LKIPTLLKKLKKTKYNRYFSLKIDIEKWDLADSDKLDLILKKATRYFEENYVDVKLD